MSESHDAGESVFNPVQVLILALFLQLLVFFILMNSISVFSQAKDRMRLLQDAVRGVDSQKITGTSIFPGMGNLKGSGTADNPDDQMAKFAHEVPGLTDKPVRRAGALEITFGGSEMNRMLGLTPGTQPNARLLDMIKFVRDRKQDAYRFVLIKNIRPEVYASGLKDPAPSFDAIRLWTEKLVMLGVPADMLRSGLASGPAGAVTLRLEKVAILDNQAETASPETGATP